MQLSATEVVTMTARPQRETPTTCALLLAMMAAYAAVLLPVVPRQLDTVNAQIAAKQAISDF